MFVVKIALALALLLGSALAPDPPKGIQPFGFGPPPCQPGQLC